VATGKIAVGSNSGYSTSGPMDTLSVRNTAPPSPPSVCYIYAIGLTCLPDEVAALANGTAVVKDYVVVRPGSESDGGNNNANGVEGTRLSGATALMLLTMSLGAMYIVG
jgi:hypothetical protein